MFTKEKKGLVITNIRIEIKFLIKNKNHDRNEIITYSLLNNP